ncbi:MAG: diguanylate cyclase [Janthinobacterium lividum]
MIVSEETLDAQVGRLSHEATWLLSFPDNLERKFELTTRADRCRRLWWEGIVAIALFNLFLLVDYLFSPSNEQLALLLRLGVVTPLALVVNVSMLLQPPERLRESSIAFATSLAGLTELVIDSNRTPINSAYAQFGVLAVLLFANTVMRLRFPYACAVSATMAIGECAFLRADHLLPMSGKALGLCLTLCTMAITMVGNHSHNREERLNFLLRLRGDNRIRELMQVNEGLAAAAQQDGLTGLANRSAFDTKLTEVWHDALGSGAPLSLILIDVDYFKQINDSCGHLYGDKVLKRVAHLLTESLRGKDDFLARFGGEEFVIILPHTAGELAMLVAERLRKLVEVAGLPALEGPDVNSLRGVRATVSCGVASTLAYEDQDVLSVLQKADEGLYRAKA